MAEEYFMLDDFEKERKNDTESGFQESVLLEFQNVSKSFRKSLPVEKKNASLRWIM